MNNTPTKVQKSPSTKLLKNLLMTLEHTNLFEEKDDENNIRYNELKEDEKRAKIQGGTVPKLVQKLTSHEYSDPQYVVEFIYTYTAFSSPKKFLKLLIARFDMVLPKGLEEKEQEEWKTNVLFPVRLRVVNAIKTWATKAFFEFEQDQALRDRVLDFLNTKVKQVKGLEGAVKQVEKLIQRNLNGEETTLASTPPKPHKIKKTIKFVEVHPEEFARQFSLMGFKIFASIRPRECLHKRWQSLEKEKEAPQILAFVDFFNYLSDWVATKIVMEKTPKARAAVIAHIIKIGLECKKLNNFCGVMQIVGGLRNSAIKRLKKTWALVPSKSMEEWQTLLDLTDSNENFLKMRQQLQLCTPPALPYIGIFLQDLLFIDDGNTDKLPNTELINFNKLRFLATVIQNITTYQSHPYYFSEVPQLQTYINDTPAFDSAALENSSLFLEPRDK